MRYQYDLIIIGAGGAGLTAAFYAAGLGKKVAVFEANKVGGECTWSGCIPSKALIKISKKFSDIKQAYRDGYLNSCELNSDNVMNRVREVISEVYAEESPEVLKKSGIDVFEGERAEFVDKNTLKSDKRVVTAKHILISTGSSPFIPPIKGIDTVDYYTNETIFSINELPKSMVVIGGGPIGIELASSFSRLGVDVSVIEMFDQILPRDEKELVDIIEKKLRDDGVKFFLSAKAKEVNKRNNSIEITVTVDNKDLFVTADMLLVASGRRANNNIKGLDSVGVKSSERGWISTDEKLKTTVANIYASGDIVGPYQFSHMANYQSQVAVGNMYLPVKQKLSYKNIPWITFTAPELAHRGYTENEARKIYPKIYVYSLHYSKLDRAIAEMNTTGMIKVITDKKWNIIGIHIVGETAGEILHQLHTCKTLAIPLYKISKVIHAYPSYSDIVKKIANMAYIDKIQSNPIIKLVQLLRKGKK